MTEIKFQIGKSGITEGVIESLRLAFTNRKHVRISVLKSSGRDRESIREMAEMLAKKLPKDKETYTYRIIGFTMIMRRPPPKR